MLKPNRLVAMATAGKLAEVGSVDSRTTAQTGVSGHSPVPCIDSGEMLASLSAGLRRLCELAFSPTPQVHELAAKAVAAWLELSSPSVPHDNSVNTAPGTDPLAVRLLTALAVYLELCGRDRTCPPTGAVEAAHLATLVRACGDRLKPEVVARCPALRRLLKQYETVRPAARRAKQSAAA